VRAAVAFGNWTSTRKRRRILICAGFIKNQMQNNFAPQHSRFALKSSRLFKNLKVSVFAAGFGLARYPLKPSNHQRKARS
jgi:hypothetical protein